MWHLGFQTVPPNEARVIEELGKFHRILEAGLNWVPFWQSVRLSPETGQYKIPIFSGDTVQFDFVDGALTVKGAEVTVQIRSPRVPYVAIRPKDEEFAGAYRAAYFVVESRWKEAVKDLVENAVRAFFNNIPIMAWAENVTSVYPSTGDFLLHPETGEPILDDDDNPRLAPAMRDDDGNVKLLKDELKVIGFDLLRITFADFEPSEAVMRAREAVAKAKADAIAAEFVADQRNIETMGSLLRMYATTEGVPLDELTERISGDATLRDELREVSRELIVRRMSLERNALTDIRVNGAGDVGNFLVTLATILGKKT